MRKQTCIEGYLVYRKNGKVIVKNKPRTARGQSTGIAGIILPDGTWEKCELSASVKLKIEEWMASSKR